MIKDDYYEYYDDENDIYLIECKECDTLMGYNSDLREFKCPCCNKVIFEDDYNEYYDNCSIPTACRYCGGPYPLCLDGCGII